MYKANRSRPRIPQREGARHLCRVKLLIALAGLIFACAQIQAASTARSPARPNIVLILADDLGFSDLGCFGSEISTPNLDRLGASGMRFTQFYTTPRCCPTRASLLTGLYPQQAGIGNMMEDRGVPGYRGQIGTNCITIAEELRAANYHALMVGKWHVCHIHFDGKKQLNFESDEPFWDDQHDWPLQRGFEEYYGTIHGVSSYFDPFSLVSGNTPISADGKDFYYTDAITDHSLAEIEKCAHADKPFFLYVAYTAPHWPMQAPEADIAKYRQTYLAGWDAIRANRYRRQLDLGLIDKAWALSPRDPRIGPWENVRDKEWEANRMATYAAMVERMDRGVGRILAKIRETGIERNTLLIFFSDNGACDEIIHPEYYDVPSRTRDGRQVKAGNADHSVFAGPNDVWQSYGVPWANVSATPFRLYKHFVHEGGIATPFIAYWPGVIKSNTVTRQLGHVTDLMATFVELSGAHHPATYNGNAIQPLEGKSLLPIFEGKQREKRTPIFWEHEGNRAVRDGKWKLVSRHGQKWELHDMEADRTELHDLADAQPERVKAMEALYEQWAKRCDVLPVEQLPKPLPTKAAKMLP
jgi:arylsulfatase A-like enzyme